MPPEQLVALAQQLDSQGDDYDASSLRQSTSDERLWLLTVESRRGDGPTLCFLGSRANPDAVTALVDDYTYDNVPVTDAHNFGTAVLERRYRIERRKALFVTRGRLWLIVPGTSGEYQACKGVPGELSSWETDAMR